MRHENFIIFVAVAIFLIINNCCTFEATKRPTVLISILIRNKAHTLPYFLTFLQRQNYPKNRISLWIRSDNNIDNSVEILKVWLGNEGEFYHSIDLSIDAESRGIDDETGIADWSHKRFQHVIKLREEALNYGRKIWADYIFMLDADVFLTNPDTLNYLIEKNKTAVGPLLKSDGMYSNFWAGMNSNYYYERTERYKPLLDKEEVGCFDVPMIHTAVLLDLNRVKSDALSYKQENIENYDGPKDDIITFAIGAKKSGVFLYICNDQPYGFLMVPLEKEGTIQDDLQQLTNLKLEILGDRNSVDASEYLRKFVRFPPKDTMNFDRIFMINLLRRPEKRKRMANCFNELGIDVEIINAIDGSTLNEKALKELEIKLMPDYVDPFHKRPMTMGEIGCFLSHFTIWTKVVENKYNHVMVLEDDVKFEPFFRQKVHYILKEIEKLKLDWDLIYIGRKRQQAEEESWVEGSRYLVHAGYSYWTLGYLLSQSGARKLLEAKPLDNLLPVDEYLPIMFNSHPRDEWNKHFPKRDLIAFSVAPLFVYPMHYTGESGYISDTENSKLITNDVKSHQEL